MKTYSVDTNVFLRFLLHDNQKQYDAAVTLFSQAKIAKVKLTVSQIVIFEIQFVLQSVYKLPKKDIIEDIKSLLSVPYFQIQDEEIFLSAINVFEKSNTSLVDCFLVSQAELGHAELFTFDQKLQKLFAKG